MIDPMPTFDDAYAKIKQGVNGNIEALESARLVEAYRQYFRPSRVRVVLLAESHVFTSDTEREIVIPTIPELPGYPTRYARFVYCLGYGERALTTDPRHPRRDGTPQYWEIFFSCCNRIVTRADFAPILTSKTPYPHSLRNKIALLKQMRDAGIWLVDASIIALYHNGTKTPDLLRIVQESWRSYTRPLVLEANPERVICIGRMVGRVVEPDLQRYFPGRYDVISQPNARLSAAEHMQNFRKYNAICGAAATADATWRDGTALPHADDGVRRP